MIGDGSIKKVIFIVVCVLFVLFGLFLFNGWHIDFEDLNMSDIEFNYDEEVKIQTPKAYFKGNILFRDGFEIDVKTDYLVEEAKIGTYEVNHSAKFLFYSNELKTFLHIVDKTSPIITLEKLENSYVTSEEEYLQGVSAYDEYDGDITEKVTHTFENGVCTFSVEDNSGNKAIATRVVIFKDVTAPVITLIGENTIILKQGETYQEQGYYAIDDVDGDITKKVSVKNEVNTSQIGEYRIIYSVVDTMNNATSLVRKVVVIPNEENVGSGEGTEIEDETSQDPVEGEVENPEKDNETTNPKEETPEVTNPEIVDPNEDKIIGDRKVIYLTFDDGPSKYTKDLLAILKKYNVKATFFVVGLAYQDVISDIYADGHAIGIHSYTHEYSDIYASEEAYFADLYKMRDVIYEKTGYYTNLVRFPGGSSNTISKKYNEGIMTRLAQSLEEKGFAYFDWNVSSGDAGETTNTVEVYKNVVKGIGNKTTAIVLQHDSKKYSVEAVEDIILWGLGNDYIFLPLDIDSPTSHHKISN